jgi:transposase-like protein
METQSRIPVEVGSIQYNHCKNPSCSNFGIPASQDKKYGNSTYTLSGSNRGVGSSNIPLLRCNSCSEHFPLKSNKGISEELSRISNYLKIAEQEIYCPHEGCSNNNVPVGTKKAYRSFGTSSSGSKRYQCCACNKTFSVAKSTQWQHDTHHNIEIFKLLVNKVPLNRIIEITGISWKVLYNRIDYIHRQCMAFASNRENKLKNMSFDRLYISVDRQEYTINWTERKDKRNTIITGIASADNETGYIFGIHPNFDGSLNKSEIEEEAISTGDHLKSAPFRKYARLWLEKDYSESIKRSNKRSKRNASNLVQDIAIAYENAQQREDVEGFDNKDFTEKLPDYGVQVHAEYTMIAHFHFLKKLFGEVGKWRFFLDQDSGIRGACLSAFAEEIKERTAEAFYVKIEKNLTVDEKRKLKAIAKSKFEEMIEQFPNLTINEIKIELLKQEILANIQIGNWKDKWIKHPFPDMAEANKAMCWLTEHSEGDMDLTHKAWLYNKATLHGVDSFFQKVRRRVAMLERPIGSASNNGRIWNGYGAYNPSMVVKMVEIYRVVHNYIDVKKGDKTTPAMRLGLAQARLDYKTVLYNE